MRKQEPRPALRWGPLADSYGLAPLRPWRDAGRWWGQLALGHHTQVEQCCGEFLHGVDDCVGIW
jgi:hypothetical protein